MKKIKFLLPLFVLFIALFTSCDSQMKEPEYTVHQDEWKIDKTLWGKKFKLLTQESDVATEGALFGYLEITADGSDLKITVQESDESLFAPYKGLRELYKYYADNNCIVNMGSENYYFLYFDSGINITNESGVSFTTHEVKINNDITKLKYYYKSIVNETGKDQVVVKMDYDFTLEEVTES